jgi:hypothetical protein
MQKIKVRLLISIDEWDKYAEINGITIHEAIETKIFKYWYIETNKDIADNLINNNMAINQLN